MVTNIPMNAGTYLVEIDPNLAYSGEIYMLAGVHLGGDNRPLINFTNMLYSGEILSAKFYIYVSNAGGTPWVTGYKVNRVYDAASCWGEGRPWTNAGCNGTTEDRSASAMITSTRITATGWTAMPIADLTELVAVLDGHDTILLVADNHEPATIEKSPAPYLEIITPDPSGIIMF